MVKQSLLVVPILLAFSAAEVLGARFVPLGAPIGTINAVSSMYDLSADGSIVVGLFQDGPKQGAFRWTQATGMTALGDSANGPRAIIATAISGNGLVVVGELDNGDPYKWTLAGGLETIAPRFDEPAAINFDGSVIFGRVNYANPFGGIITDASSDGSVVVGGSFAEGYLDKGGVRS